VRIIAATNADLEKKVKEIMGLFMLIIPIISNYYNDQQNFGCGFCEDLRHG
jgi:hypothetical protein